MGYANTRTCLLDLERHNHLKRIDVELDPVLEIPAVQRRVSAANGPALWFTRPKGCRFTLASNIYGTVERIRFIFRDTLSAVHRLMELQADPEKMAWSFWRYLDIPWRGLAAIPRPSWGGPVFQNHCSLSDLPKIKCWPRDGGSFVTLPLVFSEDPQKRGWRQSNLGMYRIQLDGNDYIPECEIGLHYQIHRGIGVHQSKAVSRGETLGVNVMVGGPPAWTIAAVMPLPEGIPEVAFAGVLAGRPVRLKRLGSNGKLGAAVWTDADFAITGTIASGKAKPEGPFGDHLGYYSLTHDFPVMNVQKVYHRSDAVWPFTVVGRPPQEDSAFGSFIHEITDQVIPSRLPGVHAVHAVDEAGVHPLLFALGSERYTPFQKGTGPAEILTQANLILGTGQLSLAKYLMILNKQDSPLLDIHDKQAFLLEILKRVDWRRDLHFQTKTTMDTLDYSGEGLNRGSKVVWAAAGPEIRELVTSLDGCDRLPGGLSDPKVCFPGVVAVRAPAYVPPGSGQLGDSARAASLIPMDHPINRFALICLCDDPGFLSQSLANWLWACFTKSDPARDLQGVGALIKDKHWGCEGALVLDARSKPHMAPPLVEDPETEKRIESLAVRGGPLNGLF